MYHPTIVNQRLDTAEKSLGWRPIPHSADKVEEWRDHLNSLLTEDHVLDPQKRPNGLTPSENRWVTNERRMCKSDFNYFCRRYAHIRHYEGRVELFKPNIAQRMNLSIWAEMEVKGHPIELIQLKARRLGMSTLTDIAVAHRTFFYPNINAVVASSDPRKTEEMGKIVRLCYEMLPWWLAPTLTTDRTNLMEFKGINSGISFQHGSQWAGVARGASPSIYHLSELPDWEDAEELVDASLLNAIIPNRNTFGVLESTAKGFGNWWYKKWKQSDRNYPLGKSRLRPIFLPWYVGTDIKPHPDWVKAYITDRGVNLQTWEPALHTWAHKDRAENYVASKPLLQRLLGTNWTLPAHQMYWWELNRQEHYEMQELNKFLEENPADDMEAFQSTNVSVFSVEEMEKFMSDVREPMATYVIESDDIDRRFNHDPRERHPSEKPFVIRSSWNPLHPASAVFVPVVWKSYDDTDWENKLLVWEKPLPGEEYGLGIDTGYGMDQDRSVIQVIRKGSMYRYDEQVAEWANAKSSAKDLWPLIMAIATWYAQASSSGDFVRQPRVVVECNGNGIQPQWDMELRGWSNFHPWLHYDSKGVSLKKVHKWGWFTNVSSRKHLMINVIKALKSGWLQINSKLLVEEMQGLQKEEDEQYISSLYGFHDDRYMALGMVYFSMHILEIEQARKGLLQGPNDPGSGSMGTYRTHYQKEFGGLDEMRAWYTDGLGDG